MSRREGSRDRPLVGISLCLDQRGRWRTGHEYAYIDTGYGHAVQDAGGVVVHLPIQTHVDQLLDDIDGLLLSGGDDLVPPSAYPPQTPFNPVPEDQLRFDCLLLGGALERGLPVLGICYGMQLLALQFGGKLAYHIPLDQPEAGEHQLPEPDGRHGLIIEERSSLESLLGRDPGPVNSMHHQAVSEPGDGLRVSARAEDGLIEAIESVAKRFWIGVQWHPEKLTGVHRDALFEGFVFACGRS